MECIMKRGLITRAIVAVAWRDRRANFAPRPERRNEDRGVVPSTSLRTGHPVSTLLPARVLARDGCNRVPPWAGQVHAPCGIEYIRLVKRQGVAAALYSCMRRPARTQPLGQDHVFCLRTQGGNALRFMRV